MTYKHVILDRDGVLNREAQGAGYILSPAEFFWLPGALEALAMLRRAGIYLSVATNQSGVGRGLMTLAAARSGARADAEPKLSQHGAALDAVLFCPHAPGRRLRLSQARPGLIHEALARSGSQRRKSIVVGDDQRDLEAASRAGVRAVLVRTGKGRKTETVATAGPRVPTYDDLPQLARAHPRANDEPG